MTTVPQARPLEEGVSVGNAVWSEERLAVQARAHTCAHTCAHTALIASVCGRGEGNSHWRAERAGPGLALVPSKGSEGGGLGSDEPLRRSRLLI